MFLDYNKACDKVRHDYLIQLFRKKLDMKDIRIIQNLYYNQNTVIKKGRDFSGEIKARRGVRQDCVVYPYYLMYVQKK